LSAPPTHDTSLYARVATGFRIGGINSNAFDTPGIPPTYGPDSITNCDLGVKKYFLEHRMYAEGAVYYIT
jgi:iron complex outermembrane receptor protein